MKIPNKFFAAFGMLPGILVCFAVISLSGCQQEKETPLKISRIQDMGSPRALHAMLPLQSGKIAIVGSGQEVEMYNPQKRAFTFHAKSHFFHGMSPKVFEVNPGKILIVDQPYSEVFDLASNTSTPVVNTAYSRRLPYAEKLPDGTIIRYRGQDCYKNCFKSPYYSWIEKYNPLKKQFEKYGEIQSIEYKQVNQINLKDTVLLTAPHQDLYLYDKGNRKIYQVFNAPHAQTLQKTSPFVSVYTRNDGSYLILSHYKNGQDYINIWSYQLKGKSLEGKQISRVNLYNALDTSWYPILNEYFLILTNQKNSRDVWEHKAYLYQLGEPSLTRIVSKNLPPAYAASSQIKDTSYLFTGGGDPSEPVKSAYLVEVQI